MQEEESEIIKARREQKVSGILHEGFPVRSWDHDIAPTRPQMFVADAAGLMTTHSSLRSSHASRVTRSSRASAWMTRVT